MPAGRRSAELIFELGQLPGRCQGCGAHLELQGGHIEHCPLGPRASFTLTASGAVVPNSARATRRPAPAVPEPPPGDELW
jgi:hypothetical protein